MQTSCPEFLADVEDDVYDVIRRLAALSSRLSPRGSQARSSLPPAQQILAKQVDTALATMLSAREVF